MKTEIEFHIGVLPYILEYSKCFKPDFFFSEDLIFIKHASLRSMTNKKASRKICVTYTKRKKKGEIFHSTESEQGWNLNQ